MNTRMRGGPGEGQAPLGDPRRMVERAFRWGDVPEVRRLTQVFGARMGIGSARLADFVLAVNEAAACATARGPCTARVRLWVTGTRAFCEVRGDGRLLRRAPRGPSRPGGEAEALRRLVLQRVSDYVSVAAGPDEVRVLLSMRIACQEDSSRMSARDGHGSESHRRVRPAGGGPEPRDESAG